MRVEGATRVPSKQPAARTGSWSPLRAYHDRVFERFWKRELDIEDVAVLGAVLQEVGADASAFADYAAGEGRAQLTQIQCAAEAAGVFGVTSFLLEDGSLYWGREHLPRIKELLQSGEEASGRKS